MPSRAGSSAGGAAGLETGLSRSHSRYPATPALEVGARLPAELAAGPVVGDLGPREVAVAARGMDDARLADLALDRLGDLLDRHRLRPGEVVDAAGGARLQRRDDAVGEVLDVDEAARLASRRRRR